MGTFQNLMPSLCFICVLFVIFTYGNGFDNERTRESGLRKSNKLEYDRRADGSMVATCPCSDKCMTGNDCDVPVDTIIPKFNQHYFKVVNWNPKYPINYNATTYQHTPGCPCDTFVYSITSVESDNSKITTELFIINKTTGEIRLNENKAAAFEVVDEIFTLHIQVRNEKTGQDDQAQVMIIQRPEIDDNMYGFGQNNNGYEPELLHRHRRAIVPTEVEFTQTILNGDTHGTNIRVGKRITVQLDIVFPSGATDMIVELFSPDDVTNVMVICDVNITYIGPDLTTTVSVGPQDVVFGAKTGYSNDTYPDWAIIDLGTVNNGGATTAELGTITILYEAVVLEDTSVPHNTEYWLSAGALYDLETYIWVGQHSFNVQNDGNLTVASEPVFNVTMPTLVPLGSIFTIDFDLYIPYPIRDYVVKVFPPADTVGLMSICDIWLYGVGPHYACGNDLSGINSTTTRNPQGAGYAIATLELGRLLNKGAYDNTLDPSGDLIGVRAIAHLYADAGLPYLNTLLSMGVALEVDSVTVWIGNVDFTVAPEVTVNLTDPNIVGTPNTTLNVGLTDAVIMAPFDMIYTIAVPLPVNSDVASEYTIEMLMPMDGQTPEFSICQFEIISVGRSLSCLIPDEIDTVFSSRGNATEPDKASLSLGHVINLGRYNDPGDDEIVIKATMMPLNLSTNVFIGSQHNVSFGVLVGTQSLTLAVSTITIGGERSSMTVTNVTQPNFSIEFYDGNSNVQVGSSTKVLVNMTTTPGVTYDSLQTEFLMPKLADTYAYFHICRVVIENPGRNIPCMSPDWYNDKVEYNSTFSDYIMDRSSLSMGAVCNLQEVADTVEDTATFAAYIQVLDRPELQSGGTENVGFGLLFPDSNMWVANLPLTTQRGGSASPAGNSYTYFTALAGLNPLPSGLSRQYRMYVKIPRGQTAGLSVVVTSLSPTNIHICNIRVIRAGNHLPCVIDAVGTRTYDPSMSTMQLNMGMVTNYGDPSEPMTANSYFDEDTMEFEYIVRAAPIGSVDGTYSFDARVYFNTAQTSSVISSSSLSVTNTMTNAPTGYPVPIAMSAAIGEITGGDNGDDISAGEAKRILITLVIPESSEYKVIVRATVPTGDRQKLELCQATLVSVGDNLPCISPNLDGLIYSTIGDEYKDEAEFNLGYVCSTPLRPGDAQANTVVFEVYARLIPNNMAAPGTTVTLNPTVQVFNNAPVILTPVTLNVVDSTLFQDRHLEISGIPNTTLVTINETGTIVMRPGDEITLNASLSVPRQSVSRLLFDVEMPVTDSACMTVTNVRVIGSVGENVLCVEGDINGKQVVYNPVYEFNGTQSTYVYLDLGIVTNTGKTHLRNTFVQGDDDVVVQFDMQMADCYENENGTIQPLSIGKKISDHVVIYDHDVEVFRDGAELIELNHTLSVNLLMSTSTVIYLNGTLSHNISSTAEGVNTSIYIFLPFYQLAPTQFYSNISYCNIVHDPLEPNLVEILCDRFFFTDVLDYGLEIQLNTGVTLPPGYISDPSYAFSMVGTDYIVRFQYYNTTDWFPYFLDEFETISYALTVPTTPSGCSSSIGIENTATVLDCQFESSSENIPGTPASGARYGAAAAWVSFIRDHNWAENRFVGVYLGHQHEFNSILIKNTITNRDQVTEISVAYTNDGRSFFGDEIVDLGASPAPEETRPLSGVIARGVRITITNDTASGTGKPQVGLQFKLFGCQKTDPDAISSSDACAVIAGVAAPTDYYSRSFVGISASEAYFCDRDITVKKLRGVCFSTADGGATWRRIGGNVGSLIGFSPLYLEVFAYNNDKSTLMAISTLTGRAVTVTQYRLTEAKLDIGWIGAIAVPENDDVQLTGIIPTVNYTLNSVGANYEGVFMSNVKKVNWN